MPARTSALTALALLVAALAAAFAPPVAGPARAAWRPEGFLIGVQLVPDWGDVAACRDPENLRALRAAGVGALVVFNRDTSGVAALAGTLDSLRRARQPTLPLLLAWDVEGGTLLAPYRHSEGRALVGAVVRLCRLAVHPTEPAWAEERRYYAYLGLADGAHGICYLALRTVLAVGRTVLDSTVAEDPVAAEVLRLNRELSALGPILVRLEGRGVWRQRRLEDPEEMDVGLLDAPRSHAVLDSLVGGGDGVVGLLRDPATGADYLWIVNSSLDEPQRYNVRLGYIARTIDRVNERTGAHDRLKRRANGFDVPLLPPGAGALYRVTRL
jgi:hypothetical protein